MSAAGGGAFASRAGIKWKHWNCDVNLGSRMFLAVEKQKRNSEKREEKGQKELRPHPTCLSTNSLPFSSPVCVLTEQMFIDHLFCPSHADLS